MGWIIVGVIAGLLVTESIIQLIYVRIVLPIFETKPPFNVVDRPLHPAAELISFPTSHGLQLHGSLYRQPEGTSRGLIVFCPELDGNHRSVMSYCEGLYQAGFELLAFDFRSQGDSDRQPDYEPIHWMTSYEITDVINALEYVESRDDLNNQPLGLMGVSRGSTAALVAAARFPHVHAVCCEGGYSTSELMGYFVRRWATVYMPEWMIRGMPAWHFRVTMQIVCWLSEFRRNCRYVVLERWLPRLRHCPVLLISGDRDNYVHSDIPKELIRRINSPNAEVWVVPRAKHNQARKVAKDAYDQKLVDFFSAAMPAPSAAPMRTPATAATQA